MTTDARFRSRVNLRVDLARDRAEDHLALFVVDADSFESGFASHGRDDIANIVLLVQQHAVVR